MNGLITFPAVKAGLIVAFLFPALSQDSPKPAGDTQQQLIENLQKAYDGESNAAARYESFAKKADDEGYQRVAVLFRAAAKAEKIHASNHAGVLKGLGVEPVAEIKAADVKSTKENLQNAVGGETYERDTMYVEFIAQARAVGNKAALRSFNLAKSVEAQHALLYSEALANLDSWKQAAPFYVCPECGNTVKELPARNCPVCFTPKEKFQKVS